MRERFQLPIPMWGVQFALLGGWRRMLMFVFGYAGLLTVAVFAVRRLSSSIPFPTVAGWCLTALAGIQIVIVMLGGCNAVYRAALRDFETKMIESHRITPMSSVGVCLGYLFGSTLQILALFATTVAFAAVLSMAAGSPLASLFQGSFLILSGAISLWSAVVFAGMRLTKPVNPAPVMIGLSLFSVPIMLAIPGAASAFCLYSTIFGFSVITGVMPVPEVAVIIVALVNVLFAFLWLGAAAVKYRRPDLPALSGWRGLVFLFFWLVVATGGVLAFEHITRTSMRGLYDRERVEIQWIATMMLSLVAASVVTLCTAQCHWLVHNGRSPRSAWDRLSPSLVSLASVFLVLAVMGWLGSAIWRDLIPERTDKPAEWVRMLATIWSVTALSLFLAMSTARGLFLSVLTVFRVKSAWITTIALLSILWAGPPLLDGLIAQVFASSADAYAPLTFTWLFGCSAPGAIGAAWAKMDVSLVPGLVAQGVLAGLVTILALRGKTSEQR